MDSVRYVEGFAFENCSGLKYIFFAGSERKWEAMSYYFEGNVIVHYKATHHKWSKNRTIVKRPTSKREGMKAHTCVVCGAIKENSEKTIPKLRLTLPAVKITAPKAAKKSATVNWKKVSRKNRKKIAKVQIQYSPDRHFKKSVTTVYANKSAISKKITNLKSRKKYYVRIRAYRKSGEVVHVSKWSAAKSVRAR